MRLHRSREPLATPPGCPVLGFEFRWKHDDPRGEHLTAIDAHLGSDDPLGDSAPGHRPAAFDDGGAVHFAFVQAGSKTKGSKKLAVLARDTEPHAVAIPVGDEPDRPLRGFRPIEVLKLAVDIRTSLRRGARVKS